MVTVHHQQSGLEQTVRVVVAASKLPKSSPQPLREFHVGKDAFVIIHRASKELVDFVREEINHGHTAAIIPHALLKPSAMFFDMDATVIAEESLVEIAKTAGKEKEIETITTKAMAGGMDFKESLTLRLGMLKGLHRDHIHSIKPTINPGMSVLAGWCHDRNIPMFLISGGFIDLAGPVASELKFKDVKANRFAWDGDRMAGRVEGDIIDGDGKKSAVANWCQIHDLDIKKSIVVGDGANDLPMMSVGGLAVGFAPKKTLWPHLSVLNATGNHRFLQSALED
jgi:phosphoserine phosphatase